MAYDVHAPLQSAASGLAELEQRVRDDLACLCYPPANWVAPTTAEGEEQVHDVVIIGGGMCGLVASFALIGAGIRNIRIFDRSPVGFEGPWLTYARMETLRSPKQLIGPAYGMASLTFRAWYRRAVRQRGLGGARQDPAADVDGLSALVPQGARPAGRERRRGQDASCRKAS